MHESVMRESYLLMLSMGFLSNVRSLANKGWVRLVPAAAVTPAPRVVLAIIGPKAFVAGLVNSL